jgi:PAS domain S-box-containing protein
MEAQRHQVAASVALGGTALDTGGHLADRATTLVRGTDRERARAVARAGRPWILAALHAGVALAFLAALARLPALDDGTAVPWILLAIAYAAVEFGAVDVPLAGGAVTIALRELPLVVGLFVVAPVPLVAAQVAGIVAASAARRARLLDTVVAIAATSLATVIAIIIFRAIHASGEASPARAWTAALAGAVGAVTIIVAARSGWGRRPAAAGESASRRSLLAITVGAAVVDASLGMVVTTVVRSDPLVLGFLSTLVALGGWAYGVDAGSRRRRREMELIDAAGRVLQARLETAQGEATHLAALVTSFDEAIITISPRGIIRTWNPAAAQLFDLPASQAIGRRVSRLLPRERRAEAARTLGRVRAGGQVRDVDFEIVRADGSRVAISAMVSPIVGPDGVVSGASAIIRDETNRRRADAALRVTADRFRGVFQGSPVGMGLVGQDFAWIRVNEALCRLLGRREDELVGEPSLTLVHPDDEETVRDLLARVARGDSAGSIVEARYVPTGNRVVWVKITTRPLRDAGTRALQALCIIEDVTEQRHAEERARETEARFHRAVLAFTAVREPAGVLDAVLIAARDLTSAEYAAIAVLDEAGAVVDVVVHDPLAGARGAGVAAVTSTGGGSPVAPGPAAQVIQVVLSEAALGLLGPDGMPVRLLAEPRLGVPGTWPAVPGLRSFLGVPIVYEGRMLAKLYLWNRRTAGRLDAGRLDAGGLDAGGLDAGGLDAGGFDRDDEKVAVALAAQASISLENARIHDRDAALMRELDRTNADLVRANAARSAFLASISHELRTPLHSILAAAELIHDPLFGPYSERRARELGTTIQGSGRHLLHLIDDLVDLSRIEAGGMDLRLVEVPLGTILAEIRSEIAPLAAEKGISLRVARGRGPIVAADPLRLRQVLLNLLANAVKFTGRGGRIRVEVRRDDSGTTIAVHDTGIGIAPDDLERAFQPFEQVSGTNSPGAGLGLAISRRLVELHGGRLTVTSRLDHGSTFTVQLPPRPDPATDAPPTRRVPAAALPKPAGDGRPILLVEDDEAARAVLADVLERGGYPVLVARDVREALEHLETQRPALVVLDLQLGDEDGLAVARLVRARQEKPRLPILVLTAGGSPSDPERALAAGCDLYLAKPIGARQLLGHIHRLLTSAGAEAAGRSGTRSPRPTTHAGTLRGTRRSALGAGMEVAGRPS